MSELDDTRPFTLREDMAAAWTNFALDCASRGVDITSPAYFNSLLDVLVREARDHGASDYVDDARRNALMRLEAVRVLAERWELPSCQFEAPGADWAADLREVLEGELR